MKLAPHFNCIILAGALVASAFSLGCSTTSESAPATTALAEPEPQKAEETKAPPQTTTSPRGRRRVAMHGVNLTAETPVDVATSLRVESPRGAVIVEADDGDTLRIEAVGYALSPERAESLVIATEPSADELRIRVVWPEGPRDLEGVQFRILTPRDLAGVRIETTAGQAQIIGPFGSASIRTTDGDIVVRDIGGPVDVETNHARITIESVRGDVRAVSVNGVVTVADAGGRVFVETTNAGVDVKLSPTGSGPVDIATTNGVAQVTIGAGFSGQVLAETSRAPVEIGVGIDPSNVRFDGPGKAIFDLGGGQTSRVKSSRGTVRISRNPNGS